MAGWPGSSKPPDEPLSRSDREDSSYREGGGVVETGRIATEDGDEDRSEDQHEADIGGEAGGELHENVHAAATRGGAGRSTFGRLGFPRGIPSIYAPPAGPELCRSEVANNLTEVPDGLRVEPPRQDPTGKGQGLSPPYRGYRLRPSKRCRRGWRAAEISVDWCSVRC